MTLFFTYDVIIIIINIIIYYSLNLYRLTSSPFDKDYFNCHLIKDE